MKKLVFWGLVVGSLGLLAGCGNDSKANGTWVSYETDKDYVVAVIDQKAGSFKETTYEDGKKPESKTEKIKIEDKKNNIIITENDLDLDTPFSVKGNVMEFNYGTYYKKDSKEAKAAEKKGKAERVEVESRQKAIDEKIAKSLADVKAKQKAADDAKAQAK